MSGDLWRRLAYPNWENEVVERLPLTPKEGLDEFFKRYDIAELDVYDDLGTNRQGENAALRVIERREKRLGASDDKIKQMMLGFKEGAYGKA